MQSEQEWTCGRCGYKNAISNEVCMGAEMGDGRCGNPKPKLRSKPKSKPKPRVFVLQKQQRYDISAVKYYSKEIIYIIKDEHINPFDTGGFTELVRHRLIMEDFNPDLDFVCLTGSSILLSLFLAVLVKQRNFDDQFKVLMFDAKKSQYKLRILNLGE